MALVSRLTTSMLCRLMCMDVSCRSHARPRRCLVTRSSTCRQGAQKALPAVPCLQLSAPHLHSDHWVMVHQGRQAGGGQPAARQNGGVLLKRREHLCAAGVSALGVTATCSCAEHPPPAAATGEEVLPGSA